ATQSPPSGTNERLRQSRGWRGLAVAPFAQSGSRAFRAVWQSRLSRSLAVAPFAQSGSRAFRAVWQSRLSRSLAVAPFPPVGRPSFLLSLPPLAAPLLRCPVPLPPRHWQRLPLPDDLTGERRPRCPRELNRHVRPEHAHGSRHQHRLEIASARHQQLVAPS